MFSHIVVPVDTADTTSAHQSVATAKLNLTSDGSITLLHVVEPLPVYVADQIDRDLLKSSRDEAQRLLEELRDQTSLPPSTKCILETGRPYRKILEHVTNPATDAIVMAGHSPKFSDVLLGSVAAQVVRHAKCSVFVLRHQSD